MDDPWKPKLRFFWDTTCDKFIKKTEFQKSSLFFQNLSRKNFEDKLKSLKEWTFLFINECNFDEKNQFVCLFVVILQFWPPLSSLRATIVIWKAF